MSAGDMPRVAIVGGGLAGLAAAAALVRAGGVQVRLYEARRRLGGRAASFRDPAQDEWVDHCQHVSMRCCTNLADFCRRTGLHDAFETHRVLHFIGPDGRRYDFAGSRSWPAPLHLAGALWRLKFLSPGDRIGIARALFKLARLNDGELLRQTTTADWLRQQRQSPRAIEQFWELVLQSALGESVEHASLLYARKVFVDGFMAAHAAYEVEIPTLPLGQLYGTRLERWLAEQGVELRMASAVQQIEVCDGQAAAICLRAAEAGSQRRPQALAVRDATGADQARARPEETFEDDNAHLAENLRREPCDYVIVAAPWRHVPGLFDAEALQRLPSVTQMTQIESSPIAAVHLWFDRPITELPHAVLVGRLSQWVFRRPLSDAGDAITSGEGERSAIDRPGVHYYQVVISASRSLQGRPRDEVVAEVVADLKAAFSQASEASLLRAKVVSDPHAVFSVRPGIDDLRPSQQTEVANLFLAGDWTQTTWPATMEGAVRSGYLAAEALLASLGRPTQCVMDDLPSGWLAKRLIRPVRE